MSDSRRINLDDVTEQVDLESDSETEEVMDSNISNIIDQIGEMNSSIRGEEIKEEENEEKKLEMDKIKIEFFFSFARKSFDMSLFKTEFLCVIYDYCLKRWNLDLGDEDVYLFKKIVMHCLKEQPKYAEIIKEIEFNEEAKTTNMILINYRRIFQMNIGEKKYNLKHDGTTFYL